MSDSTTLYRACSRCGELHARGPGYSYCRTCATAYQRERRKARASFNKRIESLEARVIELERWRDLCLGRSS